MALGKEENSLPSVCPHNTRQRAHRWSLLSVSLPSALGGTRQSLLLLPSARATTLGREALPVPRCSFFVECYDINTQQSASLSSVTLDKVTSIPLFICFCYSIQTNKRYITYTSHISHNHHIHNRDHIFHKSNKFFTNMSMSYQVSPT